MIGIMTFGGKDYRHFRACRFTKDGRLYTIVGTTSTGRGAYDAIDTVKNDAGEFRDFTRLELLKFCEHATIETIDRAVAPSDAGVSLRKRRRNA